MTQERIIEILDAAYEEGNPIVSDETYDAIREKAQETHPWLVSKVGSNPREGVKLPVITPSLDKLKDGDGKKLELWANKQEVGCVYVTDKLDGISALYEVKGGVGRLFSRGNGIYGEDISHLIPFLGLPPVEQLSEIVGSLTVRGEIVLPKSIYKGRNIVAGMANSKSKEIDSDIAKHLVFKAHRLYGYTSISGMYDALTLLGFSVVNYQKVQRKDLCVNKLSEVLRIRKEGCEFPLDGVVVCKEVIPPYIEEEALNPSGNPINPKWMFAFKSSSQQVEHITSVTNVEWLPSKNGYLIPTIHFSEVEVDGVRISKASGQNGAFIVSNNIGPGSQVVVVRSGDVIPYIKGVVTPSPTGAQLPPIDIEWNESKKHILAPSDSLGVRVQRLVYFCKVMGLKGVDRKVIEKLGVHTLKELLSLSEEVIKDKKGFSSKGALNLISKIRNTKEMDVITWIKASDCFQNISSTAIHSLLEKYPEFWIEGKRPSEDELKELSGVGKKVALQLLTGINSFIKFLDEHSDHINIPRSV